jgi:FHS family Na+ dependent glucose MFS transporter 1
MVDKKKLISGAYDLSFIAMGISMASLGPTLPGLAAQTSSSLSAISILFTARGLGGLAGSFIGGRFYDQMRGHFVLAATIIGMAVMTALTPFVPLLWLLAAVLFLTGALQGVLNIGGNAMLVWLIGDRVGPFMLVLHFCFGVGTFMTPVIIAQFLTIEGGLYWTYLLLAVLMLPAAAVIFLPSPASPASSSAQNTFIPDRTLILLISCVFGLYSGASLSFGGWIFTYAIEMDLTTPTNAAYLTSLFWGSLTLGRLAAIPIAIRYRPQTILRANFIGALLSLMAMLLWPTSLAAVMITSAGLGFALASIYPTTMTFAGQIMPLSGKITGIFAIGSNLLAMLIPWIIGQFFETVGPQSMTIILIIDMLLALVVLALLSRRIKFTSRRSLSNSPELA